MPCSLETTQANACTSGLGKVQDSTKLLQLIAQLTCEAAESGGGGGGATQFIQLTDVPNSYAGQGGMGVRVNAGATGLEFYSISTGVTKNVPANVALDGASATYTIPHGLGAVPAQLNVVLVCTVNDGGTGLSAGQESDVASWFNTSSLMPAFRVDRDATNVIIRVIDALVGNEGNYQINSVGGGSTASPTSFNNFAFKIYAWI